MDVKVLTRLRPENERAAAIADALDRVSSESLAADARRLDLQQARTQALLTATPKLVAEIEAERRETEIEVEQLEILTGQLRDKLAAARAVEKLTSFQDRAATAREKTLAALSWWRDEYPKLACAIAEGLTLCKEAELEAHYLAHAFGEACRLDTRLSAIAVEGLDLPVPPRAAALGAGWFNPAGVVQLPAGPDDERPIWWPSELRGRPRPQGY